MTPSKEQVTDFFSTLQDAICSAMEKLDGGAVFSKDKWSREGGGGGLTRAIVNGKVLEKGCVNFSAVSGKLPAMLVKELKLSAADAHEFFATGVSIVMHPHNPMVPIIHMNVRYFEVMGPENGNEEKICWFGGGIDLTPHYINKEDAEWFHTRLKKVCDLHHSGYYPDFKKWADDYFFIPHRNETRGVGGIFFDRMNEVPGIPLQNRFDFVKAVGNSFAPFYSHLVSKNKDLSYSENEKRWQFLRRGRYVEFNLVYDRGTRFGLETNGRTESILLSMPPRAEWLYDHKPAPGSPEENTLVLLKKGINWAK